MTTLLTVRQVNTLVALNAALKAATECGLFDVLDTDPAVINTFCDEMTYAQENEGKHEYAIVYHVKTGGVVREDSCLIVAQSPMIATSEFLAGWHGEIVSIFDRTTNRECSI